MGIESLILIIDDEAGMRTSVARTLESAGHRLVGVPSAEEGQVALRKEAFDLVLCDIRLGGIDGLEMQRWVRTEFPEVPVVMITAFGAVETAVKALKQGAYDYLIKPFSGEELRGAVRRALESRRLRLENDSLRAVMEGIEDEVCASESVAMKRLYAEAARVAESNATVFISGESGTGKEILAKYLHANSPRRAGVFVALNCAAVPETLADSHIFGHVRGAFTGAVCDRRGTLEIANGGTLFLDEIAELKPELQAKLLRVLEEMKLRRLGSEREVPLNVRILAAAQKSPEQLVKAGSLREDLYFRVGAIHLHIPPLRERPEDIPGLALHFLKRFATEMKKSVAGLEPEAMERLKGHLWPGNVRELKNVIERAAIFVRSGERVQVADLPEKLRESGTAGAFTVPAGTQPTLKEVTDLYSEFVLKRCEGNQAKASRILGVAASTLWRHRSKSNGESQP
ncbi:MAG: sigma-54-dependent Fis family transcriptional regulator [Planctomycetes bacterium]|nr:sigma-54-dependent Fis family transcriptional regulator [Planctomycetota bacterium]